MDAFELFKLAWHALISNKLRSILTTLGIIIGVFSIILLVSLGSGLQKYITQQIEGFGSNLIFVIPGRIGGARTPGGVVANKLLYSDADTLAIKLHEFAQVAPVIQSTTSLRFESKTDKNASVLGTTSNYPQTVQNAVLEKGQFFTLSQVRSASKVTIVGITVVTNLFPQTNPIGQHLFIGKTKYLIIGILKPRGAIFGMDQDNVAIVPVTTAKQQFGLNNPNAIYISTTVSSQVDYVTKLAQKILLKRLTVDDFTVQTSASSLDIITNITNILSLALGGIAAISLLVGGIGVANIMLVSVTERTREIGLRKALGALRSDILKQFLLEAVILSVSGGILGIILGLGASYGLSLIFVSQVTPWSVFLAFSFSVLVGIVFGMAPAVKASKLSPIEALRYE